MTDLNIQKIVEELIDTFYYAGKVSLDLREKGLIKNNLKQEIEDLNKRIDDDS